MIRIFKMSGEEMSAFTTEETSDVRWIKSTLRRRHGLPLCLQQILHEGSCLDDASKLEAPVDVQLVLLTVSTAQQQRAVARELTEACEQGDVEVASKLLQTVGGKDLHDSAGDTALTSASRNGQVEIVRLLLEAKANKDLQDSTGSAPLVYASEHGHLEIVQLLLAAGADRNQPGNFSNTPLICAAENGHVAIAQLLLAEGADKELQDNLGNTAVICAAENGALQAVLLLLQVTYLANRRTVNFLGFLFGFPKP